MSSRPIRSYNASVSAARGSPAFAPTAKHPAAPATSCFFHGVIWIGCTPCTAANCAVVC
jgi:hypothetical protein